MACLALLWQGEEVWGNSVINFKDEFFVLNKMPWTVRNDYLMLMLFTLSFMRQVDNRGYPFIQPFCLGVFRDH